MSHDGWGQARQHNSMHMGVAEFDIAMGTSTPAAMDDDTALAMVAGRAAVVMAPMLELGFALAPPLPGGADANVDASRNSKYLIAAAG